MAWIEFGHFCHFAPIALNFLLAIIYPHRNFDKKLILNKHFEHIKCKLNRGIGVLQKITKFVQEKNPKKNI